MYAFVFHFSNAKQLGKFFVNSLINFVHFLFNLLILKIRYYNHFNQKLDMFFSVDPTIKSWDDEGKESWDDGSEKSCGADADGKVMG